MAFGNATIGDLKKLAGSGGGGSTSDYSQLTNKPSINGVELLAGTEIGKLSGDIKVGISALDNVNITNAVDGQTLLLNALSGKWENGNSRGFSLTDIKTAITTGDGVDLTTINAFIIVGKDTYNRLYSDIIPASLIDNGTKLMTAYSTDITYKTYLVTTFSVVSNIAKITTEGGDLAGVYAI